MTSIQSCIFKFPPFPSIPSIFPSFIFLFYMKSKKENCRVTIFPWEKKNYVPPFEMRWQQKQSKNGQVDPKFSVCMISRILLQLKSSVCWIRWRSSQLKWRKSHQGNCEKFSRNEGVTKSHLFGLLPRGRWPQNQIGFHCKSGCRVIFCTPRPQNCGLFCLSRDLTVSKPKVFRNKNQVKSQAETETHTFKSFQEQILSFKSFQFRGPGVRFQNMSWIVNTNQAWRKF